LRFPRAINLPAPGSGEFTPAVACAALAGALALQLALPQRTEPDALAGRAPRLPREEAVVAVPEYQQIFQGPIFAPTRAAAGAQGNVGAEPASGSFEALGVGIGPAGATAVLRTPAGQVVQARPGQVIDGWRVAGVAANRVVLTKAGERATLLVGESAVRIPQSMPAAGNDEEPISEDEESE
jgi:hypothetical protein